MQGDWKRIISLESQLFTLDEVILSACARPGTFPILGSLSFIKSWILWNAFSLRFSSSELVDSSFRGTVKFENSICSIEFSLWFIVSWVGTLWATKLTFQTFFQTARNCRKNRKTLTSVVNPSAASAAHWAELSYLLCEAWTLNSSKLRLGSSFHESAINHFFFVFLLLLNIDSKQQVFKSNNGWVTW